MWRHCSRRERGLRRERALRDGTVVCGGNNIGSPSCIFNNTVDQVIIYTSSVRLRDVGRNTIGLCKSHEYESLSFLARN